MSDKREALAKLAKVIAVIILTVLWIWALYPAPDQPIIWDQSIPTAMEQKGVQIYEISGFGYIQSGTRFNNTEIEPNNNATGFTKNVTAGVVLFRLIDKDHNMWREFTFLPVDETQKIQRYVEIYDPPPSLFSYGVKDDNGTYHFGKNYFLVIFAIVLTFMAYVLFNPRFKGCGY